MIFILLFLIKKYMALELFNSFYVRSGRNFLTTDLEAQSSSLLLQDDALRTHIIDMVKDAHFRYFLDHPLRDLRVRESLASRGWRPLSPSVFTHIRLPRWMIKTNYGDGENEKRIGRILPGKFDNLQRPLMGQALRRAAEVAHLRLVVPKEYLVTTPSPVSDDLRNRFFVICETLDIENNLLSGWEALYSRNPHTFRETVQKVCRWIILGGVADATLSNIRFLRQTDGEERTLAAIDSEGIGLLKDAQDDLSTRSEEERELSPLLQRQKYGLAGLTQFASSWRQELLKVQINAELDGRYHTTGPSPLLAIVEDEVERAKTLIHTINTQETLEQVFPPVIVWNWPLIVISIFIPLTPLILLIASAISHHCQKSTASTPSLVS